MASIPKRNRIGPRVRIRHRREFHRTPGFPVIRRPDLEQFALLRPSDRFELFPWMEKNARLDRADFFAVVYRRRSLPGYQVPRALDMHATAILFGTARAQQRASGEGARFVFAWGRGS